jgi:hypothetical protein
VRIGRAGPLEVSEAGRHARTDAERKDELLAMIGTRAGKLAEADKDLPVDEQSEFANV